MNIKAERIENLIQIVNRNLLLIFSGQKDGMTPMSFRRLQRVDAGVFGSDKFAFEMVHFVKSNRDDGENTVTSMWERSFQKGLETLLVECAVVTDDIERDCFVSRVYCWFTEKLAERRDLPKRELKGMDGLRSSVEAMGGNNAHTLRGIDAAAAASASTLDLQSMREAKEERVRAVDDPNDRDLPTIELPTQQSKFGARKVPVYVKHNFPNIFRPRNDYESFLPKIPGAEDNYGMLYHKPETEGEKQMHELWVARRRQEAFDWKTQQHMALVMDRLALHKSRLESDALRKQESNAYLHDPNRGRRQRPFSADDSSSVARFSGTRPTSGKRQQGGVPKSYSMRSLGARQEELEEDSPATSPERDRQKGQQEGGDGDEDGVDGSLDIPIVVRAPGLDVEAAVPVPGREVVFKEAKKRPKKESHLPMRFRMLPPDEFSKNFEKQQYYMQLSDSDDDDQPDRPPRQSTKGSTRGGAKAGAAGAKVNFKREKPAIRERPVSAKLFRAVSTNDSEFKVHYRHTNYRRMPLTEEQEQWLENKEAEREKKSLEKAQQLVEEAAAKADKKKDKEGGKKDDKKDKKEEKGGKGKKAEAVPTEPVKIPSKYKSASQFMAVNFPNFEADDDGQAQGPMRIHQLIECARIMGAMADFGMEGAVTEAVVRKALVIPQDKPEAISLENLRENECEGLMRNPIPFEFWRKVNIKAPKKGGGGGKKKKK